VLGLTDVVESGSGTGDEGLRRAGAMEIGCKVRLYALRGSETDELRVRFTWWNATDQQKHRSDDGKLSHFVKSFK
jgi:hypothetical protein